MSKIAPSGQSNIEALSEVWESLAQEDPLWAIFSAPDKKGKKWELDAFFETGVVEINDLMTILRQNDISFEPDVALDFGCGIGRLSQALMSHFRLVCGVDVAPTMITIARQLNRDMTRCSYFLNQREDLRLFPDHRFSFICSILVLQHLPPDLARKYIAEFVRILRPNGLLIFQLPTHFIQATPLSDAAFTAEVNSRDLLKVPPGLPLRLNVSVRNSSSVQWDYDEPFRIALGNHWLSVDGSLLQKDDGRTTLPPGLVPQQQIDVVLEVQTPKVAGNYTLELDLVQEGVTWFKDKGSKSCCLKVAVVDFGPANTGGLPLPDVALKASGKEMPSHQESPIQEVKSFAMNCIPRSEIMELLTGLGCGLELVEPSGFGGRATYSYVYYARKHKPEPCP